MKSLFENWPQNLLRPVFVNVLTAIILFLLAVSFKPLIFKLFRSPKIPEYPLFCTAEPYRDDTANQMKIDFFIINRTDKSRTRQQLVGDLKALNPSTDRVLSPDIKLKVAKEGEIHVAADEDFNRGKGRLRVLYAPKTRKITIVVERIEPRALLKVAMRVSKLRFVSRNLDRGTKGEVVRILRNYEQYQDGCYTQ